MEHQVYKVNEITQHFINSLSFEEPLLDKRYYFIKNNTDFYIQLNVSFHSNCYKYSDRMYCSIICDELTNEMFLKFDNSFVDRIYKMFPLWFNKRIELESLIEYYVPSVLIEDNDNDDGGMFEDISDDDSSNDSSVDSNNDSNDDTSDDSNHDTNNEDVDHITELDVNYVICEIPYDYVENDLDIMIYDNNNELIEIEWSDLELCNKSCVCVVKLKGIKIEDSKFYAIWDIIQIKLN